MTAAAFTPGNLVTARGRDWIVLGGSTDELLRLRPISGSEEDQTILRLDLEPVAVKPARFPPPPPNQVGSHDSAVLLRDALLLSLRRGAGPFRGFGQIAVQPRAYQLVPLLMALKLDPVRLLIADDVGVGKTVEAGLIARELLDRGDIGQMTVLCPPHLVDQWVSELQLHFNIRAVPVTAHSARRLERDIPPGMSLFKAHPHTVVSLDYIKSKDRRDHFVQVCPSLVIVDEAHTCASTGRGRHQRHALLRQLADTPGRHIVLLTATPHSGDEEAFFRLLGLLDREFAQLASATGIARDRLRERLARHFVQRRRPDIAEWHEGRLFPKRETKELTYKLSGDWNAFFNAVLDYCADVVVADEGDAQRQRLSFWGTLALLRCASSSPMAAVLALRSRAGLDVDAEERDALLDRLFDGEADDLPEDDVEPAVGAEDPALGALLAQAEALAGQSGDPKLKLVIRHVDDLVADGFRPVVFCRYIATAHYLGRHLARALGDVPVGVVTGELTQEERRERVERLGDGEGSCVLVATDCLSEGINMQDWFDAVVHYDLSWNPTRHEQREGRVDRFGQKSPVVRTSMLYGVNNPVDGAVLEVILRKAAKIREELGVPVPVPDEGHSLTQALMRAVLIRRKKQEPGMPTQQMALFESRWRDAADKAKASRTLFAQRRLKPEEVLPEYDKVLAAIGGRKDVERFTGRALTRLGSGLDPLRRGYKVALDALPSEVKERLAAEELTGALRVDFDHPAASRCQAVQRSHPLVSVLAESLLERSLSVTDAADLTDPSVLGRVGCWVSTGVARKTTIVLLRLRHQLSIKRGQQTTTLLVEEAGAVAWTGAAADTRVVGDEVMDWLTAPPDTDPPVHVRQREVDRLVAALDDRAEDLAAFARERAQALLDDHLRVREASRAAGSTQVTAMLPPDIIGAFVLLPQVG